MVEFLIFLAGLLSGITVTALLNADKDDELIRAEIDRNFYKRAYKEKREALHIEKENAKAWEIEAKKWANELGEQKIDKESRSI